MQQLIKNLILPLSIAIILVFICYGYIDKPVAFWVYSHHLPNYQILLWFTYIADLLVLFSLFSYLFCVIRYCFKKTNYLDQVLLLVANSVVISDFLKDQLKFVFGRYWPATWTHNNPSLLGDGAYGFNFFHSGSWYQSFPSGHTTITVAAMTIIWIIFPRWRWFAILVSLLVIIGLIGMDYHFVGDVIGGAFVGGISSVFIYKLSNRIISQFHNK